MARILIIDDSPTDTRVFTTVLEKNGHEVLSAGSAEDGIEVCKRELPDLVLMDVILPGMNGFQATRSLSKDPATSGIPIIIVSTRTWKPTASGACARAPRITSSSRRRSAS